MKMSREFYTPKDNIQQIIRPKGVDAEIYLYTSKQGQICAVGFSGKRSKPDFRFRFIKPEHREKRVSSYIAALVAAKEAKVERRAKRKLPHDMKPGDVLCCSWGYDQTNVDFYQVTEIIGKTMIEITPIGQKTTDERSTGNSMASYVLPVANKFTGKPMRKKVDVSYGKARVSMNSYSSASFWDGSPCYSSWYA